MVSVSGATPKHRSSIKISNWSKHVYLREEENIILTWVKREKNIFKRSNWQIQVSSYGFVLLTPHGVPLHELRWLFFWLSLSMMKYRRRRSISSSWVQESQSHLRHKWVLANVSMTCGNESFYCRKRERALYGRFVCVIPRIVWGQRNDLIFNAATETPPNHLGRSWLTIEWLTLTRLAQKHLRPLQIKAPSLTHRISVLVFFRPLRFDESVFNSW